jgi:hypothetical protein
MTTLILHPDDRSTDFLRPIYKHIPNKTVITGPVTQAGLHALIRAHDQIIMLGHGSPNGLFSISSGWGRLHLIGADEVEVLRGKELVAIWCHANQFMEQYQLGGLYSGMFVSEVIEAKACGLGAVSQGLVTESNDKFASVLGEGLIKYPKDKSAVWSMVLDQYSRLAELNQIAEYNVCRWYYKGVVVEG